MECERGTPGIWRRGDEIPGGRGQPRGGGHDILGGGGRLALDPWGD